MAPISMYEVKAERFQALIKAVGLAAFGTLWHVEEHVWKGMLAGTYDQNSTRGGHPGCSVRRCHSTLTAVAPMLHGTSGKSRTRTTILVRDVYEVSHETYFGGLDPVNISLEEFRSKSVTQRGTKGSLNEQELKALELLCKNEGW